MAEQVLSAAKAGLAEGTRPLGPHPGSSGPSPTTPASRRYVIRLRGTTITDWTFTPRHPGVQGAPRRRPRLPHGRYGAPRGRADGYAWSRRHWPALLAHDPPNFPNTSASDVTMPGDTDASTDSGDGIAVWQTRAFDLGYRIAVRPAVQPKLYSGVSAVIGDNPDPAPGLHLACGPARQDGGREQVSGVSSIEHSSALKRP